jgi:hypothetical protein
LNLVEDSRICESLSLIYLPYLRTLPQGLALSLNKSQQLIATSLHLALNQHHDNFQRDVTPTLFPNIKITVATNVSMTTSRTPLMDISNNDMTSTPVATGSRRKSGRAVKAPEKFVPDAPSSQAGPANSKRKREEDAENDASDVEDEEEEESDDTIDSAGEEDGRETRKKAKTAKKPAAKKAKVNGNVSHEDAPAVKLPNRPKKAGKRVAIADKDAEGLYGKHVYFHGLKGPC